MHRAGALAIVACLISASGAWGKVLREFDYASGTLSAWTTAYSADESGGIEQAAPGRLSVVASPTDPSQPVLRAEVQAGDLVDNGNRAEVYGRRGDATRYDSWPDPDASQRWYRWSVFFPPSFPEYRAKWQIVTQWRHDGPGGLPEIALAAVAGQIQLRVNGQVVWSGALHTGSWDYYRAHIRFSPAPGLGLVELWRGSSRVVSAHAATERCCFLQAGPSLAIPEFLKMGLYRDNTILDTTSVYLGPMLVASDAASVGL